MSEDHSSFHYFTKNNKMKREQIDEQAKRNLSDSDEHKTTSNSELLEKLKQHCNTTAVKWALLSELSPHDKDKWVLFGDGIDKVKGRINSDKSLEEFKIRLEDTDDPGMTEDYSGTATIYRHDLVNGSTTAGDASCELFLKKELPVYHREVIFVVTCGHLIISDKRDRRAIRCRPEQLKLAGFRLYRNSANHPMFLELQDNTSKSDTVEMQLDPSAIYFDYYCSDFEGAHYDTRPNQLFCIDIAMIAIHPSQDCDVAKLKMVSPETTDDAIAPEILQVNEDQLRRLGLNKTPVYISMRDMGLVKCKMIRLPDEVVSGIKRLLLVRFNLVDEGLRLQEGDSGLIIYLKNHMTKKLYKFAMYKGLFSHSGEQAPIYQGVLLYQNIKALSCECIGLEDFENILESELYEAMEDVEPYYERVQEHSPTSETSQYASTEEDQILDEEHSPRETEDDSTVDEEKDPSAQNTQQKAADI